MNRLPEIISSRLVYSGRLVSVRLVRAKYVGREVVREVVEHPGSVAIVATDSEGRFLLVSQYRIGVGEETLEIPAGTLEEGEEPARCAERELEEETGLKADGLRLIAETYTSPGYSNEKLYIFVGRAPTVGLQRHDVDENIKVVRLTREQVLDAIRNGSIRDLKSIAALLMSIFMDSV
ncbi:ADP-ribose pyrophosphatase [Candidatus Calditenuaceae archaeon HR02]|nr:ADP-ribose pyrophosphatase [Candidatus Calditenuaceae archaeon HR02]